MLRVAVPSQRRFAYSSGILPALAIGKFNRRTPVPGGLLALLLLPCWISGPNYQNRPFVSTQFIKRGEGFTPFIYTHYPAFTLLYAILQLNTWLIWTVVIDQITCQTRQVHIIQHYYVYFTSFLSS